MAQSNKKKFFMCLKDFRGQIWSKMYQWRKIHYCKNKIVTWICWFRSSNLVCWVYIFQIHTTLIRYSRCSSSMQASGIVFVRDMNSNQGLIKKFKILKSLVVETWSMNPLLMKRLEIGLKLCLSLLRKISQLNF